MKTTDFIRLAKKYIIYANIIPKGEHRLYATPVVIQFAANTFRYLLMTRILYDDQEMIIYDYRGKAPYLTIAYQEIKEVEVSAAMRIVNLGIAGQQFHVVLHIVSSQGDFEIESCDEDHVLNILKSLHHLRVPIQDPHGILKIMIGTCKDPHGFYYYMIKNFSDIAKKYDLVNPRIDITREKQKKA